MEMVIMEKNLRDEMMESLNRIEAEKDLPARKVFLFGHCSATLELADLLKTRGLKAAAILDNSKEKQGLVYRGVPVIRPAEIMEPKGENTEETSIVLIVSRFYAAMHAQLRELGYNGPIRKVVDYNTFAEYSLSEETIGRMRKREQYGASLREALSEKYEQHFQVFCPFTALGDIYFMISYWQAYAKKKGIEKAVFCVPGKALSDVIRMFGDYAVEVYPQKDLDAMIQSAIYTQDKHTFIAHQDRPYVVNLAKALYLKRIPLEKIYCCGVYGLPTDTKSTKPKTDLPVYNNIDSIPEGRAVIFSPFAKSVTAIEQSVWGGAVNYFVSAGYKCYTNVVGDEKPLPGTVGISPSILEMRSVVERAGTFVGIRSGLCDILREAKAKKIALYPDYNYCDTRWKSIEMYHIDQFEHNLLATEEITWEIL